jgi:hypothetical protein
MGSNSLGATSSATAESQTEEETEEENTLSWNVTKEDSAEQED